MTTKLGIAAVKAIDSFAVKGIAVPLNMVVIVDTAASVAAVRPSTRFRMKQ